jgi:homoserine O-acetyltransferase
MEAANKNPAQDKRELIWDSPTKELGQIVSIELAAPFATQMGGELHELQVCYESWGERNAAGDNVVLLVHPMTADPHATGEFAEQPRGFWEDLVGPGKVLDTDRYQVLCPNLVGSCYGTTGPRFPGPDGEPMLGAFPLLTPRDMMRVQKLFLEALGIEELALVIGPSMGGMIAWEWAIEEPDFAERVVVIAAPLVTTAHQIGMNWLQRRGIELDIDGDEVVAKFGQMIARGIGMLSYRSSTGLEERFGRDWFQKPGTTLAKRGMFNIESWLRFHGKRIVKRFDPYTYLLFSRAMDLHDVGEGRGDLSAALSRVRSRMLVLGISSDNLYPPGEVHFGADLLARLGGDVTYREIRSMHGHDAFLLETEQIEGFLREFLDGQAAALPSASEREARLVRVGLLGGGRVAKDFVALLAQRAQPLLDQNRLRVEVAGVCDLDAGRAVDFEGIEFSTDPAAFVAREDIDVLLELTPTLSTREQVASFLSSGRSVVTPNKRLVREHGEELDALAMRSAARLAYHDSIAAGWPMLSVIERPLQQGSVLGIRGVLSATCNRVLKHIERGGTLADALAELQEQRLTEPDPELDLSGWDSAQKLSILMTRALGKRVVLPAERIHGIRELNPELIMATAASGRCIRLVAHARLDGEQLQACVCPMALPQDSHLGSVRGRNHVVVLETDEHGELVQLGQGGGTLPVAIAVLNDLVGLMDPRHSWTGRFPLSQEEIVAPSYERWLGLDQRGAAVPFAEPRPGSVPMLRP